jgi:CrcB protein
MTNLLWVAAGGAVGAVLRYLVSLQMVSLSGDKFPWATLTANLTGCLLIGMMWSLTLHRSAPEGVLLFLMVGLIGAFTTFSTYSLEGVQMIQSGKLMAGFAYVLVSNLAGLFFVIAGKSFFDRIYVALGS